MRLEGVCARCGVLETLLDDTSDADSSDHPGNCKHGHDVGHVKFGHEADVHEGRFGSNQQHRLSAERVKLGHEADEHGGRSGNQSTHEHNAGDAPPLSGDPKALSTYGKVWNGPKGLQYDRKLCYGCDTTYSDDRFTSAQWVLPFGRCRECQASL
eukprot:9552391-Lingulodinium_polyedra.AAC.1